MMDKTKEKPKQKKEPPKPAAKQKKIKNRVIGEGVVVPMNAPIAQASVIKSSKKTRTCFQRLEALGAFNGTTSSYAITASFVVNPGLSSSFPWLSAPAAAYNLYKFKKIRIMYRNATNTTNTGVVVIAFNPDPNDPAPTSLAQIENYDTKLRISAWEDSWVDVPKTDLNRLQKFFIRNTLVAGDNSLYDVGTIYVACSGNASSSATIGELWLEYDVDLFAPIIGASSLPFARATSAFVMASTPITSGVATVMPFITPVTNVNAYALSSTTGIYTGISGILNIYAQVTISAATLASGNIVLGKNSTAVITANFPPLSGGVSTANVFGSVLLTASDTFSISIQVTGTTIVASPASTNAVLIINAA